MRNVWWSNTFPMLLEFPAPQLFGIAVCAFAFLILKMNRKGRRWWLAWTITIATLAIIILSSLMQVN